MCGVCDTHTLTVRGVLIPFSTQAPTLSVEDVILDVLWVHQPRDGGADALSYHPSKAEDGRMILQVVTYSREVNYQGNLGTKAEPGQDSVGFWDTAIFEKEIFVDPTTLLSLTLSRKEADFDSVTAKEISICGGTSAARGPMSAASEAQD